VHQPLVLIVDDDFEGREMYAATLASAGYRVEEAADGFEATDKAFHLRPDAILMDLLMPRLDGWEVAEWLTQNAITARIPIIAVTGAGHQEIAKAREAGCTSVLVKPCSPDEVLDELRQILSPPPA
jgi:two-component system cell cycle response regulator DivK